MTHSFPRSLKLQTQLRWTEALGCTQQGLEGAELFPQRRAIPQRQYQAETLLLGAAELATFRSFLSYAHSVGVQVDGYSSQAELSATLTGSGNLRLVELSVTSDVTVHTACEIERARRIFLELPEHCLVLSALGPVIRLRAHVQTALTEHGRRKGDSQPSARGSAPL